MKFIAELISRDKIEIEGEGVRVADGVVQILTKEQIVAAFPIDQIRGVWPAAETE